MRRFPLLRLAGAVAVLLCAGCATASREPRNLSLLKREIRAYVESGDYEREIAAVAARATAWIEARAASARDAGGGAAGGKLTVVFDLDETLFSNWPNMESLDFGYSGATWIAWVNEGRAPAIKPVGDVYRAARRLGVDVVLITGRRERDRSGTEKNLRAIECTDYVTLICKPDADKSTAAAFKTAERQRLVAQGRTIIANIGDQESDLVGGFAERIFKLPDPFYLLD